MRAEAERQRITEDDRGRPEDDSPCHDLLQNHLQGQEDVSSVALREQDSGSDRHVEAAALVNSTHDWFHP